MGVCFVIDLTALSFSENDSRAFEICEFSLEAGLRGAEVSGKVAQEPGASRVHEEPRENLFPGAWKEGIGPASRTHNAYMCTQKAVAGQEVVRRSL